MSSLIGVKIQFNTNFRVELLEEEVLYLKSRLTNVEQEKQEDLRMYTGMMENTRQAFLNTVKCINSPTSSKQSI